MITTFTREEERQTEQQSAASNYSSSRYGVLDNQMNFSDSMSSYGGYQTIEQPTIGTEYSVPSYEAEQEYNIDGIGEDCIEIVPTFMPTIQTKQKEEQKEQSLRLKLNARGKIFVSVFSVVAALLVAFCVYNAVVIGRLNNTLAESQTKLTQIEKSVTEAEVAYKDVTSVDNILASLPAGYTEAGESVVVNIEPRPEIKSPPEKSNWFDKICDFLSGLF